MTDETSITVRRNIDVAPAQVFDLLTNPDRHVEFDGSGFLRSADHPQRIMAVGDTFRMNMTGDHMGGEYQTDNHVTGYQPHQLLAWKTAPAGEEPPGWEWVYELTPAGPEQTDVTLTYDWSSVTDKQLLRKITFPLVSKDELETSLAQLAAAVSG
ncbi:MAG TPA: SRPBCC family protein [Microlunatus sp.]